MLRCIKLYSINILVYNAHTHLYNIVVHLLYTLLCNETMEKLCKLHTLCILLRVADRYVLEEENFREQVFFNNVQISWLISGSQPEARPWAMRPAETRAENHVAGIRCILCTIESIPVIIVSPQQNDIYSHNAYATPSDSWNLENFP